MQCVFTIFRKHEPDPVFFHQVKTDIFFVDWERPRGKVSSTGDAGGQKGSEAPVSIWRTYFVANEWNEIQTTRKTNPFFQIFCTLFFLVVVGFENVTSSDPNNDFKRDENKYYSPDSRIFRFAVAALVYVLVGKISSILLQRHKYIYHFKDSFWSSAIFCHYIIRLCR